MRYSLVQNASHIKVTELNGMNVKLSTYMYYSEV